MRIHRLALAAGAALALLCSTAMAAEKLKVAVTSIVEHPALDATRDGIRKSLEEAGFRDGDTITFQFETAQGSPATAAQIAQKYVGENPAVIVAIATPSAQAVVAATQDIPVVFSAVTDPVAAQLVKDRDHPGGNVTGVSDLFPLEDHLKLIKEIVPGTKKIGVPFNPGETNSVAQINILRDLAKKAGLELVEVPANKSSDVQAAAQSLIGKVDVIYTPTDNTVVSALEAVIAVGMDNNIPVFSGDTNSVKRGALASVGFDYFEVGKQTGAVVARILKGEKPGDIPVKNATGTDLVVNSKAAREMGVTLSPELLARAKTVVE